MTEPENSNLFYFVQQIILVYYSQKCALNVPAAPHVEKAGKARKNGRSMNQDDRWNICKQAFSTAQYRMS